MLLGAHDATTGDLLYLGDVGTGFTEQALRELHARLAQLGRPICPFTTEPAREDTRHVRRVEPVLVGEVVYRQFTDLVARVVAYGVSLHATTAVTGRAARRPGGPRSHA